MTFASVCASPVRVVNRVGEPNSAVRRAKILSGRGPTLYFGRPFSGTTIIRSDAIPTVSGRTFPRRAGTAPRAVSARLRDDPFRLCLLALIVLSLSKFGGYFGILRTLRPAFLLFVFCVGYAFLHKNKLIPRNLSNSAAVGLICALCLVVVGSAVFGISLGHTASFILSDFSKTLAITFLMILTIRDIDDVRRLCWAVALGGIVLAYLSIFVVGISKTTGGVTYDANDIGVFMVMSLPLVLMLLQSATGRLERLVGVVGIVLLAATIVKTQSRGAFIGAVVVAAALLLLPGLSIGRRLFFITAAAISMAVAAPAGYWTSMQTIVQDPKADYNWDSINGRRNLARRGIGYMMEYPVFGVGIDNFRVAEGTISEKARTLAPGHGIRWASPHNSFVQAGAEAGVLGLALWISLVIVNIVTPRRMRRRMPKAWSTGTPQQRFFAAATLYLPIAQIGFAVTAFFVSFAWIEPLYFLSALVTGLSLIAKREFDGVAKSGQAPGFRSLRSHATARVAVPPPSPAGKRS
jgi:putative inorganic carbon (HCO3(-)) transporter